MNILPFIHTIIAAAVVLIVSTFSPLLGNHSSAINTNTTIETKKTISKATPTPIEILAKDTDSHINLSSKVIAKQVRNIPISGQITRTNVNTTTSSNTAVLGTSTTNTASTNTTSSVKTTPTPTSIILTGNATAKSTISSNGKTIHLTMTYPRNGGGVTGTMSGDCTGNISGNYEGPSTGKLSGTAKANCSQGFFSIPVTVTYYGILYPTDSEASIHYTTSAMGQTQSGTTKLELQ